MILPENSGETLRTIDEQQTAKNDLYRTLFFALLDAALLCREEYMHNDIEDHHENLKKVNPIKDHSFFAHQENTGVRVYEA